MPDSPINFNQIKIISQDSQAQDGQENLTPEQSQESIQILRKGRVIDGKFAQRARARELAVQFLYSLDTYTQDFEPALEFFLGEGGTAEEEPLEVKEYCQYLTRGVQKRQAEIDDILLRVVTGWRPERMVAVDRIVLRLMIFEGFLVRRLPLNTAIAESVELAKTFGTDDSPHFVNGVMARVIPYLFPDSKKKTRKQKRSHSQQAKHGNNNGDSKNLDKPQES